MFSLATALVSGAPVRGLTHSICVPLRGLPVRPVLSSNTVWIDAGSAGSAKLCQLRMHPARSEEHTSELQSLMRISYAVFCLKKKTKTYKQRPEIITPIIEDNP